MLLLLVCKWPLLPPPGSSIITAPAQLIPAPAQLIPAPAQPPATEAAVYVALFMM